MKALIIASQTLAMQSKNVYCVKVHPTLLCLAAQLGRNFYLQYDKNTLDKQNIIYS